MGRPCCIIMIDSEVTDDNNKKIIPKVTMFPRLDIKTVNKILKDVLDININDLLTLIEKGSKRILGDYIVYKSRNNYYWKRVKEKTEIPEELTLNYIPIKRNTTTEQRLQ